MPFPKRLTHAQILEVARRLLEAAGSEGVSIREVARQLGVSPPSLYLYVESRDDLLRELATSGYRELGDALHTAAPPNLGRRARAFAAARAYGAFARANPQLFLLMFAPCAEERRPDEAVVGEAAAVFLDLAREFVAEAQAVSFAHALRSFVHGHAVLGLAGKAAVEPDSDSALESGLALLLAGAARWGASVAPGPEERDTS